MRQHTDLFPTDSLSPFLQGLSCELPLTEKLFHVMSNAISSDNQTYLSW